MHRIQYLEKLKDTPRPCDYFDLIGGTGTGGCVVEPNLSFYGLIDIELETRLIALMLGKLQMPIGKAIDAYVDFTNQVFSKKKIGGKKSIFKASQFETTFQGIIKTANYSADTPMMDSPTVSGCQRYVRLTHLFESTDSDGQSALSQLYLQRTCLILVCSGHIR